MPFDLSDDAADPLVSRPRRIGRPTLLAGVAAACVLGAGLGLWARPSDVSREIVPHATPVATRPAAPPAQIEIRVDRPAQTSEPQAIEMTAAPAPKAEALPPEPQTMAPKPAPSGLMRVHAVAPLRLEAEPKPQPSAKTPSPQRAEVKTQAAQRAAAERKAELRAEAAKAARVEARYAAKLRAEAAERARRKLAVEAAKAEQLKAQRQADAREARLIKAKAMMHPATKPVTVLTKAKASARRCASPDPGAALVCADPNLGAADRQMNRAYQQAAAAGVPQSVLERQQQRWLTARATAARQAPWAVHDVYLARIAQLQDQTERAAQGE